MDRDLIAASFDDRSLLKDPRYSEAVLRTVAALDAGALRVANPPAEEGGAWEVNAWVKQAVLMYFALAEMQVHEV